MLCQRGWLLEKEKERGKSWGWKRTKTKRERWRFTYLHPAMRSHPHWHLYRKKVKIKQVCHPHGYRKPPQLCSITRPHGNASPQLITTSLGCWNERDGTETLKKWSNRFILAEFRFLCVCVAWLCLVTHRDANEERLSRVSVIAAEALCWEVFVCNVISFALLSFFCQLTHPSQESLVVLPTLTLSCKYF